MRDLPKQLGLLLLSLAVGAALSELVLRTLYPQKVAGIRVTGPFFGRYDARLGWANRAGAAGPWKPNPVAPEVPVVINSQGLRGAECPYQRTPGRMRVLVLGDSLTFGYGVSVEDSFPGMLQSLLGEGVEVVNGSVIGYGLDQSYLFFLTEGVKYRPDVVLVKFSTADIKDLRCSVRFGAPKPYFRLADGRLQLQNVPVPQAVRIADLYEQPPLFDALYTRSHLYRLLFHRFSDPLEAMSRSREVLSPEEGMAVAAEIVRRLQAHVGAAGSRLTFLVIPQGEWLSTEGRPTHASAVDLLADAGVSYMDFWDTLSARQAEQLYLPGEDVHFTPQGNRLIAERIREHAF